MGPSLAVAKLAGRLSTAEAGSAPLLRAASHQLKENLPQQSGAWKNVKCSSLERTTLSLPWIINL